MNENEKMVLNEVEEAACEHCGAVHPVSEMTELLRSGTDTDYSALMEEAAAQFERLCSL